MRGRGLEPPRLLGALAPQASLATITAPAQQKYPYILPHLGRISVGGEGFEPS